MYPHPARRIPFKQLLYGLQEATAAKLVTRKEFGPLSMWTYTPSCVYDKGWNEITLMARGLILNEQSERVIATPFPKFFNLGEREESLPDCAFEVLEKLDGSLIVLWHDENYWHATTKGSFNSEQAKAAETWIQNYDLYPLLTDHTYLAEYVAPSNRIVVPYKDEELVLLTAYDAQGFEPNRLLLELTAQELGWRIAKQHEFVSLQDLVAHTKTLPASAEGFVVRFVDGLRIKIKGDEYKRIHALISRCTPLGVWEALLAGDNLSILRDQLPDEFLVDFDTIISLLDTKLYRIINEVTVEANKVKSWSDKEVGLNLGNYSETVRRFIFPYRKNNGNLLIGKTRETLYRTIRPTGNILEGYIPSYAMNRVMEESL